MQFLVKFRHVLCIWSIALLSGCATPPEEMQAAYVSPTVFASMTCSQLASELERVSQREIELHAQLKKLADDDSTQMGVGLILLWPTLFFLEGGDGPQAAEYSRLRGESQTIERVMVQKSCDAKLLAPKKKADAIREIPNRLKKLDELRDAGTITVEEYQIKRTEILKDL